MKRIENLLIYILLFVPPLVFFTDLTRNPYYFQIVLANGLTVAAVMLRLYRGVKERRLSLRTTPLDVPLAAFVAVATLSLLVALGENLSQPYLSYGIYSEGLKRWLFLVVNAVLVYYLAVHHATDENRGRLLLTVYWAGWIAAVYGILQYFGVEFIWPKVLNPFGGRSVSTFGNPNFLSSYLVLISPLAFVSYLQAKTAPRRSIYLLFLVTDFTALLCTLTRSSWAGFFVAMAVVLVLAGMYARDYFAARKKQILIPLAVFALLVVCMPRSTVGGYNPSVLQRLAETQEATTTYYGSWHQRRLIWSCAWQMVNERPVLGKGWGCFELFYPSYQGRHLFMPAYHAFRTHANNAHNEVLEIWSQTGTAGLGVYLWLLVTIVGYGLFLVRNLRDEKRLLAIGLLASLAGMWVDNLLNVSLHFAVPGLLFWWNLGLLASLGRDERREIAVASTVKRAVFWLLIAAGALLIVRYYHNFVAEIHYFSGFKASKRNDIQRAIPDLERAHALQRFEVNNNYELANCYARAGLQDKALEAYREALRANAGYDEIYFNMATVLGRAGQSEAAISEYSRSLYINPLSLDAYAALGSIYLQAPDRYGAAGVALFKQCLNFYPGNRDVWNNLGFLYTKTGDNESALAAYRKALEIAPDFELARKNYRITLARLGKTDATFDNIDRLFRGVEENAAARNWQAALAGSERLVRMLPENFKARLYLANSYFTVGRIPEAIAQYREALKRDPANIPALGNLGLAYFEVKQYADAAAQFRQILQLDPKNDAARQKLEQINGFLPPAAR
jgi:tetratricopeptide (TPR) repeat protein